MMIIGAILISGLIGMFIGSSKNKGTSGFWWGVFLGPLGWLIMAFTDDNREQCPDCKGRVNIGATKCVNCGSELKSKIVV